MSLPSFSSFVSRVLGEGMTLGRGNRSRSQLGALIGVCYKWGWKHPQQCLTDRDPDGSRGES
jgi:hypothetical protein